MSRDVIPSTKDKKGDWKPMLVILSNGVSLDCIDTGLATLRTVRWKTITVFLVGDDTNPDHFRIIANNIFHIDTCNHETFDSLLCSYWDSKYLDSVPLGYDKRCDSRDLPPPPPEKNAENNM